MLHVSHEKLQSSPFPSTINTFCSDEKCHVKTDPTDQLQQRTRACPQAKHTQPLREPTSTERLVHGKRAKCNSNDSIQECWLVEWETSASCARGGTLDHLLAMHGRRAEC